MKPFWIDLATHDLAGAVAFYREVFGWELIDGEIAELDGRPVAAFMDTVDESGEALAPTAWGVSLEVADLEKTAAKVEAAGGSVEFGPVDDSLHCLDATGAYVVFTAPGDFAGTAAEVRSELLARDYVGAQDFYSRVLGSGTAGVRDARGLPIEAGSTWRVCFVVPSVDEAVERVRAAGGTVVSVDPDRAEVADPQGAAFVLLT
ncbi:VOC family protein [Corynebacterium doosanense]|uniref:VOC domain-containing protein n=1 Tax=Corynebacterium doosanense CAU 212 = DSM 45436 TaxID=558173 RepID=A0A097IJ33_9CORY|nr:VOC family protein [Corynebacterium doosanense]AIT62152.1 hypothetical protein CDOO_01325 [Corynebacterium doosanense CAU 212 = DSM 45436]